MKAEEKLFKLVQNFDNAMLVTNSPSGAIEARPMAVAEATECGELWFVSNRHSGKVTDVKSDHEVAVTMQSAHQFITLSGKCELVDDRKKIEELWKEMWKVWFPKGKTDPEITLLKFVPSHGEYWDNSGTSGVRYMIKAGMAYLHGEQPDVDPKINASVSL